MGMTASSPWEDDAAVLDVLERTAAGESATKIARRYGTTRNGVLGIVFRVRRDADKTEAATLIQTRRWTATTRAQKPENRDGGMPDGWWRAGLAKRGGRG